MFVCTRFHLNIDCHRIRLHPRANFVYRHQFDRLFRMYLNKILSAKVIIIDQSNRKTLMVMTDDNRWQNLDAVVIIPFHLMNCHRPHYCPYLTTNVYPFSSSSSTSCAFRVLHIAIDVQATIPVTTSNVRYNQTFTQTTIT